MSVEFQTSDYKLFSLTVFNLKSLIFSYLKGTLTLYVESPVCYIQALLFLKGVPTSLHVAEGFRARVLQFATDNTK